MPSKPCAAKRRSPAVERDCHDRAAMSADPSEIAARKVAQFIAQFGESYRWLAYYAALPLILTPELLNYLRNHFLRDKVSWVAEADLLLSELCRPVGYEQFAMAPEVRAYLIREMRVQLGEAPMEEVARLLIRYARQLSRTASLYSRDELQAEQWSAMVFLKEQRGAAAQEIAEAFRDRLVPNPDPAGSVVAPIPKAELKRLVRITEELAAQLHDYPDLLRYAEDVGRFLARPDGLAQLAKAGRGGGLAVRVVGVDLPRVVTEGGREPVPPISEGTPEPLTPTAPTPFRDRFLKDGTQGPEMVWLPGGTFRMGSPEGVGEDQERPAHEVTLGHYAVGKYPVTVGEFRRFVEATGYRTEAEGWDGAYVRSKREWKKAKDASWRKPYFEQEDDHPVVCISWNDAKTYCDWLSKETGQAYELLTEAQWEHACRAGSETAYCFGDDERRLGDYAWYWENAEKRTRPVGNKRPNAWGLHDLHGNVWEWCEDWFGDYSPEVQQDPGGPESGSDRVIRGGSWVNDADYCRSAYRDRDEPSFRYNILGFRLSRTGPLRSYPFTLEATEPEHPLPTFIEGLRDRLPDGSAGPAMVWLPGGVFTMGQDDSPYEDEKPAHPVRVDAFSIGQYPVTFAEYDRFCQDTGRKPPADGGWGREDRPVINVSWDDAVAYCEWLSRETGETYRLATEAEWEYACRAGGQTRWCLGDDEAGLGEYAWYWENAGQKTHPVGGKKPNPWQLYDVHGNVWEWCADWYSGDYYRHLTSESKRSASEGEQAASSARQSASGTGGIASGVQVAASNNPTGPVTGSGRVIRGGSWGGDADYCRSASRYWVEPSDRGDDLGFRLSRTGPWRSYPVTLGGASAPPAAPGMEGEPAKPRFEPYQVFRDRMGKGYDAAGGPAMIYLPGGTFRMGDEWGYDNEKPVHPVRLDAFALGRTPVTVGEYLRFCEATNSHWPEWLEVGSQYHLETDKNDYYRQRGVSRNALDLPVVGTSWDDACAYCQWLSEQTGEVYELPTEAQWEYACRAGGDGRWCFGDDQKKLNEYAWYSGNSEGKLHPVAAKAPNVWGLHDMHGNVWEWCSDWYAADYYSQLASGGKDHASGAGASSSGPGERTSDTKGSAGSNSTDASTAQQTVSENPHGPTVGSVRVIRGGSWIVDAVDCRSAYRFRIEPSARIYNLGFRLSRRV